MLDDLIHPSGAASPSAAPVKARRALRIAFLSYRSDPRVGGQGVVLAQMAEALAGRGHRIDVISGPPYPELSPGVRLIKLPSLDLYAQPHNGHRALRWRHLLSWTDTAEYFGHLSGKFMEPWTFGRRAAKHLRAHRDEYDVVLDNQSICTGLLEIERMGLPVVGIIHHPIQRDMERALEVEPKWGMRLLIRRWYDFLTMHKKVAPRLRSVITVSEASKIDMGVCLGVDPGQRLEPQRFRAVGGPAVEAQLDPRLVAGDADQIEPVVALQRAKQPGGLGEFAEFRLTRWRRT